MKRLIGFIVRSIWADSDFFCECGHTFCKERVTLGRAEYASLLEESRPLIAAAHADRRNAAGTEQHELRGQVHHLQGTLASRVFLRSQLPRYCG